MQRAFVFMVFTVLYGCLVSCKKDNTPQPPSCGPEADKQNSFPSSVPLVFSEAEWTEQNILVRENGKERTFRVQLSQPDICAEELVNMIYSVNTTTAPGVTMAADISARLEWGSSAAKDVPLCRKTDGNMKSGHLYEMAFSADLRKSGRSPENIRSFLSVSFHTLGNITMDTLYFRSKFHDLIISFSGRAAK